MRGMHVVIVVVLIAAGASSGCYSVPGPDWHQPGTANYQRAVAERFDPYPENETGPAVVGVRPRDYQKAIPEVDRSRWTSGQTVVPPVAPSWGWDP